MKKSLLTIAILFGSFYSIFAAGHPFPAPESTPAKKQWLFKPLASNDVSLEVERLDANVQLHLYSQNMRNVDVIYIEKSKDPTGGFTRCMAVKVAENLIKSKNYISVVDDNPYDANTDCYYRIRTISATGVTRTYPVVGLSPLFTIDSETADSK
jgi:hypothetical protein